MRIILATLCLMSAINAAVAETPALTNLQVFPPDIKLQSNRGRQSFVVQASYADGITRDVTAEAKATLGNPALAKVDKNLLYPQADGATELKIEFGGRTVAVPIGVKDAKAD